MSEFIQQCECEKVKLSQRKILIRCDRWRKLESERGERGELPKYRWHHRIAAYDELLLFRWIASRRYICWRKVYVTWNQEYPSVNMQLQEAFEWARYLHTEERVVDSHSND